MIDSIDPGYKRPVLGLYSVVSYLLFKSIFNSAGPGRLGMSLSGRAPAIMCESLVKKASSPNDYDLR